MTRSLFSLTLAAALLGAAACQKTTDSGAGSALAAASADSTADAADGLPSVSTTSDTLPPAPGTPAPSATMADADFMTRAASGGMLEVEAAKQALKSSDPMVKEVANMILKDHTKANDELKALAAKKDVKLPPGPIDAHKTTLDKLMAVSGKEFDRMYLDEMNAAHDKDVAMFDGESKNGQDADVRAFAAKTLPVLQAHAELIKKHQKMM